MIQARFFDSNGVELKLGDWVKVSDSYYGNHLTFFVQLKIKEGMLEPFETYCMDFCVKVDSLPMGVEESPTNPGSYYLPRMDYDREEDIVTDYWNDMKLSIYSHNRNKMFIRFEPTAIQTKLFV